MSSALAHPNFVVIVAIDVGDLLNRVQIDGRDRPGQYV